MDLCLANQPDPMLFCSHRRANQACLLDETDPAVTCDPMACSKNPRREFRDCRPSGKHQRLDLAPLIAARQLK
jgi:hypothetical protein